MNRELLYWDWYAQTFIYWIKFSPDKTFYYEIEFDEISEKYFLIHDYIIHQTGAYEVIYKIEINNLNFFFALIPLFCEEL